MTHSSTVCILMGTYNGQAFLAEQLLSIENQSHKDWRLVISDDGSTDDTLAIAKTFQEKWGKDRIEIRLGPKQGFCKNFLNLACDSTIKADFYAFADQDDIWMFPCTVLEVIPFTFGNLLIRSGFINVVSYIKSLINMPCW